MPKSIPVVLKKSVLATAIVMSLSACSSAPKDDGFGLSSVGSGLAKAGKATANASRKTWNKTTYLLGFTDSPGDEQSSSSDEKLLAADNTSDLESPAMPAIESKDSTRPVLVQQATAASDQNSLQLGTPDLSNENLPTGDMAAANLTANGGSLPLQGDMIYTVAPNETLWDIAKRTTGDANNWHVLADVNNLGQSATVFPGQELVVPASVVKSEYATTVAAIADPVQADIIDETQNEVLEPTDSPAIAAQATVTEENTPQVNDTASTIASNSQEAESFEIQENETLWDFAKRTTGDATNWKAIASHNEFTEKQAVTVRPGQTIFVPAQLVNEYEEAAANATNKSAALEPVALPADALPTIPAKSDVPTASVTAPATVIEPVAAIQEQPAINSQLNDSQLKVSPAALQELPTVAELQAQRIKAVELSSDTVASTSLADETQELKLTDETQGLKLSDETQDIKIVEAAYKSDEVLDPVDAVNESGEMMAEVNIPTQITVSGTYYPKAVYNNADFSSSLLMRVSPGTTLQVSKAMGTWFEVETESGLGYVHQRDIK